MATWKRLCDLEELREGIPEARRIGKKEFLVLRRGERVFACGNVCPHNGAPLSDGIVRDTELVCPWHNARFDLREGRMVSPPSLDDITRFEVKVEDGEVLVGRPGASWEGSGRGGNDHRTFVVVGAGAAGAAAVEALRREGFEGRLVLVGAEPELPYDRPELSKGFLTGEISEDALGLRGEDFYDRLEVERVLGVPATALDPDDATVTLADDTSVGYDRLLLATGGRAKRLPVPGAGLSGCHVLRSHADARAIAEAVSGAERAVLLGASFIALESASALRARGLEVDVVAPEAVPLERVFGSGYGNRVRTLHEQNGVRFHLGRTARELRGDGRVREVELDDGSRLPADVVLMGVGIEPELDWLEGSGLVTAGEVVVDTGLETAVPGVFAAGDVAAVPRAFDGMPVRVEHWTVAERQGRHAARGMLGRKQPFAEVPFFWSIQCDSSLKYVGWPAAAATREVVRGRLEDEGFLVGYFQGETLLGAAGLNVSWDIIAMEALVRDRVPIRPEELADPDFSLLRRAGMTSGED